jgi:hypothetical protein
MRAAFALVVFAVFAWADEVSVAPNLANDFKLYVSGMQMNETLALWCVNVAVTWNAGSHVVFGDVSRRPEGPVTRALELTFDAHLIPNGFVCLRMEGPGYITEWSCSQSSPAQVTVGFNTVGDHKVVIRCVETNVSQPFNGLDIPVTVVAGSELRLTYEWQKIMPWHRVPAGAEYSLSLDGSGLKQARIPIPWQLTVDFGAPFRIHRIFVAPTSTFSMVKNSVASLTGVPPGCMYLQGFEPLDGLGQIEMKDVAQLDWFHHRGDYKLKIVPEDSDVGRKDDCKRELWM